jgi:hypothetical protein
VSTVELAPGAARGRLRAGPAPLRFDELASEPTLDELLTGLWEALGSHCCVACPVCGGRMAPDYDAHALAIGGRCGSCDTALS